MAIDERNFRSTYYEKVGFKSVEEKRSLEILLKEKHLEITKLRQFCLRFGVPATHRNLVWKFLLGVLPIQERCHSFVWTQRMEEFENLSHALEVMRLNQDLDKAQSVVAMYLLKNGKVDFEYKKSEPERGLQDIVKNMMFYFDCDKDIFWLSKTFYEAVQKFKNEVPKLVEVTLLLLEKEDTALYQHLEKIDALKTLPLEDWFEKCFAGVIPESSLARIWDKVAAGSYKILIYTAIVLLTSLKIRLMRCSSLEQLLKHIQTVSEDIAEHIVTKTIELWQQQGSPLTVYDKPKP